MTLSISGRTWDGASSPDAVRVARRFESAWRQSPPRDRRATLGGFLAESASSPGVRLALLRAEMALRWEAGEQPDAATYRAGFPDLGGEELVALIYEEFCLREEGEQCPDPEDYLARYPEVASSLRRVLDIHGLVGSGSGQTTALFEAGPPGGAFPLAGETIAGFRLTEELGRGAFARVFLAQERQLADRPVALKVSRTGSREPQTLARLQHTHIVPVYSYRTDPATGLHLLCMPFFGRVTLARVLADPEVRGARTGAGLVAALDRLGAADPPPTGRSTGRAALARRSYAQAVAWWGARMAEALEYAHERGVLHRDVKPSNVLVTADGMPMLLDFNLARAPVLNGEESGRAVPGGTLDYMAPEQLDELAEGAAGAVDERSDIYSLGVLLYEALMGERPFTTPKGAASVGELLRRAAEERRRGVPSLRMTRPDVPAALEAVVRMCLAPDPDVNGYGSAAALAADLQAVADDRPLVHAAEPWPHRAYRWTRRHRRVLAGAVPVLLALSVVVALVVRERVEGSRSLNALKSLFDAGVALEDRGEFARASAQFEAASLAPVRGAAAEAPGAPVARLSDAWTTVEELRHQARNRYLMAVRTAAYRASADAVFGAADRLRFRLIGFGGELPSAERSLDAALQPFHVFEAGEWLRRPDLALLDPPRRARLEREVDELLFLWALALDREGGATALTRAEGVCDLALTFAAPSGPWHALKARVAGRLGDADADGDGENAPVPGPDDARSPLGCFQWGALRLRQERPEALDWFKKAARLEEGNYWFQYMLAYAHNASPDGGADAMRHYDAALAIRPHSPWVRFSRARLYRISNVWGLAAEDFPRALADYRNLPAADRDPAFEAQVRLELGLVRQSLGDPAGARADYAAVVATDPTGDYARAARTNRAKLDADAGAFGRARGEYDALVAENPADHVARLARSLLALRAGEPGRAEADLTALLRAEPGPADRAEALAHRAAARLLLGKPSQAAVDADEAWKLHPSPANERLRARVRVALGRLGDAPLARPDEPASWPVNGAPLLADLRRLADRLGREAADAEAAHDGVAALQARLTRAVALSALGDPSAEAEADRAVALAPLSSRAYLTRARVRRRLGRLRAAQTDAEIARDLAPDDPAVWTFLGETRSRSGDTSGALADFDRALALGDEGPVRSARAASLLARGDASGAVRDWTAALAHDPQDAAAYLGRAAAFRALRQDDQAIADLEQAAGWSAGRSDLLFRVAAEYARTLPRRPKQLPRLIDLLRLTWRETFPAPRG